MNVERIQTSGDYLSGASEIFIKSSNFWKYGCFMPFLWSTYQKASWSFGHRGMLSLAAASFEPRDWNLGCDFSEG